MIKAEIEAAIRIAIENAIKKVGIDGLRTTSMFSSGRKRDVKQAA